MTTRYSTAADTNESSFRKQACCTRLAHVCGQSLVADKWGQHEWGRCKSSEFRQIVKKGTPWHFWEDKSRLTEVPQKVPLSTKTKICSDPISADPIRPFPNVISNRITITAQTILTQKGLIKQRNTNKHLKKTRYVSIHYRGVQWEGSVVDRGSIT